MVISISRFFAERLGAKLANARWSWGAFDSAGRLYLRVWQDEIQEYDDGERVAVDWKKPRRQSAGRPERRAHLEAVRKNGVQYFGVVCTPKFDANGDRTIKRFDESPLLRLGKLTEDNERVFARIDARLSLDEIINADTSERELVDDLANIIRQPDTKQTTIKALVDARLGQGEFRSSVLRLWGGCCAVCGSSTLAAIRASHIKPWRDSTNDERLNPTNGLPLVASLDALFDAGLISFEASGRMLVSSRLKSAEQVILRLVGKSLTKKPTNETAKYLLHHRAKIFKA
jgi:putative restriction endonuclease